MAAEDHAPVYVLKHSVDNRILLHAESFRLPEVVTLSNLLSSGISPVSCS